MWFGVEHQPCCQVPETPVLTQDRMTCKNGIAVVKTWNHRDDILSRQHDQVVKVIQGIDFVTNRTRATQKIRLRQMRDRMIPALTVQRRTRQVHVHASATLQSIVSFVHIIFRRWRIFSVIIQLFVGSGATPWATPDTNVQNRHCSWQCRR